MVAASTRTREPRLRLSDIPPPPRNEPQETIYISGPMRGIEEFNFPAFHAAAELLRGFGYRVISPAESFGGRTDLPASDYLRADVGSLLEADMVVLLEGWQNSVGVKVELTVAAAIDLPVYELSAFVLDHKAAHKVDLGWLLVPTGPKEGQPTKKSEQETALQVANRIVHGARQKDYGHPYEDFSKTAGYWSVLFGVEVKPWQVPMAMWLLKTSRLMQTPTHYDSIVDVAGYTGTYELVIDRAIELGEI
jgi:hypothetical protein